MRTDASILYGLMGSIVTLEKLIPRKKMNMKSPLMSPPRNNPDINILITEKYPILPLHLEKYTPGYKSLLNDAHDPNSTEDDRKYSTSNSHNEKEYSIKNIKVTNNEDNDEEYKD